MAKSVSDEELQLRRRARRRLIGAIVLVTVVVVALPMVLDTEPRPVSQEVEIRIPPPDAGAFTPKIVPVAPPPESRPAPKPEPVAKPKTVPAPETQVSKAPVAAPAAKKPPPEPAAAKPPAGPDGKFVVQVIALADAQKAKQLQQQISAAGIRAYTEAVQTAQGEVTRVRVGPFATREAAEKAQQQLKGIGFDGKVVPRR
jgi:DedD protein